MDLNYQILEKTAEKMAFKVHRDGKANIWGIRTPQGEFNDRICIWWYVGSEVIWYNLQATTEPGRSWLEKVMGNKNGTAILVANKQYFSCWELGKHKGNYPALVQSIKAQFLVNRDNNKNGVADAEGLIYTYVAGLNLHTTKLGYIANWIGKFSAGCQVILNAYVFHNEIMPLLIDIAEKYKYFDYTLINKEIIQWQ